MKQFSRTVRFALSRIMWLLHLKKKRFFAAQPDFLKIERRKRFFLTIGTNFSIKTNKIETLQK
jgi:hypothetical protein